MKYLAVWHERAKIKALCAEQKKDADDSDEFFEVCERNPSCQEFPSLEAAATHLVELIKAGRDCFGQGEVREIEKIKRRCEACVCGGWQIRRYIQVDDTGIVEETVNESECI